MPAAYDMDASKQLEFFLYETLKWQVQEAHDGYLLLPEHMQRLRDSAQFFAWDINIDEVMNALGEAEKNFGTTDQRVRVEVSRSGQAAVQSSPFTPLPHPYHARLAVSPVNSQNPLLYYKTTCREVYDNARSEAGKCDDVLLWNEKQQVTESCRANILVELDGEWLTPPVSCGLLNGIARQRLLEKQQIRESIVRITDLYQADSIWLVNSVRDCWNATLVN